MSKLIYLDNAATTKTAPEVVEAMLPYFTEYYGNPSSVYSFAAQNKEVITQQREIIANALGAKTEEIYFTAGGSESDNWALKATAEAYGNKGKHIITTKIEHHAILHSAEYLEKRGYEVTYLDVGEDGVVKLDDNSVITDFVEKPKEFVSDLAIIGIYFFRDGQKLYKEIEYLLENDIQKGGEYQLTDALENMRAAGDKFTLGKVDEWMDCGNKAVTVDTNTRVLNLDKEDFKGVSTTATIENSLIIEPCFIGENVVIKNSKIGPFVSLGNGTVVENSNIDNSLIQENSTISNANLTDTMIGNHAKYYGVSRSISLGDYSELDFKSHEA